MHHDPLESLTDKQREVLELVLRRMSSKEIARELGISPWSVDKRIGAARVKLGAGSRDEAARVYARLRYGEPFAAQPFAVTPAPQSGPTLNRASPDEADEGLGSQNAASSAGTESPLVRRSVLWLDPKTIGPAGRLGLVVVGALAICLLLLSALGIANGLQSLLEP